MNWQLGLSRFIHGWPPRPMGPFALGVAPRPSPVPLAGMKPAGGFTVERERRLLPAFICALFDFEGRSGAWPPDRVADLLDLAGLDRVCTSRHHVGPNFPARFFRGTLSRGCRQTVLLEGLAALDAGLLAETGALFDELSPTLRGYVLGAFERGDLGLARDGAERFMDCMVETVTFAFLNFELELSPLPDEATAETRPS